MAKSDSSFFKTIPKLSRDPLGIIALFIALTYAIASLVLGLGSHLTEAQKWPLIIFLVAFPVIVLFSFLWLVIKYNKNLYAPSDYRSDESFLETLKPGQQETAKEEHKTPRISRENLSSKKVGEPGGESALHVFQVKVVEDLVLRELEIEWNIPFRRQMGLKTAADHQVVGFTGMGVKPDELLLVDVTFTGGQAQTDEPVLADLTQKMQLMNDANILKPLHYVVALVGRNNADPDRKTITREAEGMNQKYKQEVTVKWYDFNELLKKYNIR